MECHVAFWRHYQPYFVDAKILMAKVPQATNIYEAIHELSMLEWFSCKCELLRDYQDEQIPIRWE